jgi:iron complex outermembrane receptor protein
LKLIIKSRLNISLLVLILLFGVNQKALSQSNCKLKLTGAVLDSDTKQPLADALISVQPGGKKAFTNAAGEFAIDELCANEYEISIAHLLCEPIIRKIKLEKSERLTILLPHKTNQLRELSVVEKKSGDRLSLKSEVTEKELFESAGLSFAQNLERVEGVSLLQTGNNIFKPVINGLHSLRVPIITNEVRLESQQWGSDHAPELDPFTAQKITVIKGAGALRFGNDGVGGFILAEPAPLPFNAKISGEVLSAFFSNNRMFVNHLMVQGNSKNRPALSWRLQASHKIGGNARTPNYYLWNSGVREFNGSAQIAYRKPTYALEFFTSYFSTELGIFLGSQIGNLSDLETAINQSEPLFNRNQFSYHIERPSQQVAHILSKFKATKYFNNELKWVSQVSIQQNNRKEFDLAQITDSPELDLSLTTFMAESFLEKGTEKSTHTLGGNTTVQQNIWSGSRFFIPNYEMFNAALFQTNTFYQGKHTFDLGLRFDLRTLETFRNTAGDFSSTNNSWFNISAAGGYSFELSKNSMFLFNTGLAWRAPSVNELFVNGLHHGTASFEIGDPNLKEEVAFKSAVEYKFNGTDSLFGFNLQIHNNLIDGFINLVPDSAPILTIRGAYPTFKYVQTLANLSGFDVSAYLRLFSNFTLKSSYSVLFAYDLNENDWMQQMSGNRLRNELIFPINFKSGLNPFEVNIQHISVFEQKRQPKEVIDFLPPPETYYLINAFVSFSHKKWRLQTGVNNLFNTVYREYLNRFRYFNDEIGRNIFVRVNYKFA